MKKIFIPVLAAGLFSLTSCQDFLNAENIYNKDLDSYYADPTEIDQAIVGMYMNMYSSDDNSNEQTIVNYCDDIVLGGGSVSLEPAYYMDKYENPEYDTHQVMWADSYTGIYRANALIETLSQDGEFDKLRSYFSSDAACEEYIAQSLGEAYFMKGYYYLRLGRWFGGVPIINTADGDRYVGRSSFEDTFSLVVTCFKNAYEAFPDKAATSYTTDEYGHANKWIAAGYLSRAFLHATGYLTNIENTTTTEIPLYEESGSVTKDYVVTALEDCMANSGYALLSDFRSLWHYSYTNYCSELYGDSHGDNLLPWAKNEGLVWAGQDGFSATLAGTTGNSEVMFAMLCGLDAWTPSLTGNLNRQSLAFGQGGNNSGAFLSGWAYGPAHPALYEEWDDTDLRKKGSIVYTQDTENFIDGHDVPSCVQYTQYIGKKYVTQALNYSNTGGIFNFVYDNAFNHKQLQCVANFVLLRYSDILLMHSELTETADGMNQVRRRAGLSDTSYSLYQIKWERLYEFAYESIRFYDLVRWGDLYSNDNTVTYFGKSADVYNNYDLQTYTVAPPAEQKGLHKIPESEMELSNGAYEQNPGW
ncbi:MAG: RagB/SusD family nutrient uptake outer membrane protein [Rikenellaceae bacterium]